MLKILHYPVRELIFDFFHHCQVLRNLNDIQNHITICYDQGDINDE